MANTIKSSYAYWSHSAEEAVSELKSGPEVLSSDEAVQRLKTYGPNVLISRKRATPLKLFLAQFNSPIVIILLFATFLSAVLQDWLDALIILVIILVSAILSFVQEYSANNAAGKLRRQVTIKARVERDGKVETLPAAQVVPVDVVLLSVVGIVLIYFVSAELAKRRFYRREK